MPELPDIVAYLAALESRIVGRRLEAVRLASPFLLRTVDPPLSEASGKMVLGVDRIGKRIVFALEGGLFLILHLMISGRLHWKSRGAKVGGKIALAAFDFENGTLLLTEASSQKRASLSLVRGEEALADFDRGGIEPLEAALPVFREALTRESHTVKRALTDPRLFSGIGNAYSDEILHRARLSPAKLTRRLTDEEVERLYRATRETLETWSGRLRAEAGNAFPEKVTAFREGMAVHGRYGKPCPDCGTPVQRIVYAANESNYCPRCQTGGKLLADRALSQLLRGDWPKTLEELEERKLPLPPGEGRGEGMTQRNPPNFPDTLDHARELRGESTTAELHLWNHLRRRGLKNAKFRRQHPIGPYIVDFCCAESMLIVEIDGGGHGLSDKISEDPQRTRELETLGFRVLRFWNNEVLQNTEGVLEVIAEALVSPSP